MKHKQEGHNTKWLKTNATKAIGRLMCESLEARTLFLEKFPDCFVRKGIRFYSDFDDPEYEKENGIIERIKEKIKDDLDKKIVSREIMDMANKYFVKNMKLPQLCLFSPKKSNIPEQILLSQNNELSQMCANIIVTSSKMVNAGLDLNKLVEYGALKEEGVIFYDKDKKIFSFVKNNSSNIEEFPIYSFDKSSWVFWTRQPEMFMEAMCSYALTKICGDGTYLGCIFTPENSKDNKEREIEFATRDRKKAILCSKSPRVKNEKEQVEFCKKECEKVVFISTEKESPYDSQVVFFGDIKNIDNFEDRLRKALE